MAIMDYLVATAQDDIHALIRSTKYCGAYATREPHSLCDRNDKRPVGATQIPWKRGRCMAWDATCPKTYAQLHVQQTAGRPVQQQ